MNNILFISEVSTQFRVLIDVGILVKSKTKYRPIFLFDTINNDLTNEIEVCKKSGIDFIFSFRNASDKTNQLKIRSKFIIVLERFIKKINLISLIMKYRSDVEKARQILKANNIKSIINSEDHFGVSPLFVKAAKQLNLKSYIIPFTLSNIEELTFVFAKSEFEVKNFTNKLFFNLFPSYCIKVENKYFAYLKPTEIIAQKIVGIAALNAFIPVGGKSDLKLFESQFMLDYYLKSGLNKTKNCLVIGSLKFDSFNSSMANIEDSKKKIYNELEIKNNFPFILCSVPPDFYKTEEYINYEDMIDDWMQKLSSISNHNVILSLHPRTDYKKIVLILNKYKVYVATTPIEHLITLCEVFVASISATIRYALACNKCTVNFDVFKMNYTEYLNEQLVKTVTNKEDFLLALLEACNYNSSSYSKLNTNFYYGQLDGLGHQRIINLLETND